MEQNEKPGDFGAFFDTPGRSVDDSAILAVKYEQDRDSELKTNQSIKKQNRNNSASKSVDISSVSSDHDDSSHYSSDYVTDSDSGSDTDSRSRRKKKERSRSRSASSRSGGSISSESSCSSRRSRTRSSDSTDSSKSRTATSDSSTKKRKTGGKGKRRDSSTSVTSSSTFSGGKERNRTEITKERRKRSQSPTPKQASRRQAWNTEETSASRRNNRPQTAKRRSSGDKDARRDESRRQECNGKSYADNRDTDSDMTDVSPIASPKNGHGKELSDERFSAKSKPPMYQALPLGVEDSGSSNLKEPDPNAIDLNILMKAVSELEKQKRVKSNTRRVMFEPLRARSMEKSNYTFSNDDTYRIEHENKRLLRQIMRQVQTAGGQQPQAKDLRVSQSTLTTSAINRRRDQERIENENLSFLKRLQKIKPSRGLARHEQLTSYNSTVLHGIPIATLHPPDGASGGLRSGRQSTASSIAGSLGRTRSMTSIRSAATVSSFGTVSRQSSRPGSRPTSAKKSSRERPPWNDRW